MSARIVIAGGPLRGKSTLAQSFGHPVFCTDAASLAREVIPGTTYLPEGLDWSASSAYVAEHWLTMDGPWVIEGVATARALRKWAESHPTGLPADRILLLPKAVRTCTPKQEGMAQGVHKVWNEIARRFGSIAEIR